MQSLFDDENGMFKVLVNQERQYSLWPDSFAVPEGWAVVGPRGRRGECLEWIDKTWVDMRPLSLVREVADTIRERSSDG